MKKWQKLQDNLYKEWLKLVVRSVQKINQKYINSVVKKALNEDLKPTGDITTKLIKNGNKKIKAQIIAKQTKVKIISWKGSCIVHEQFSPKEIRDIRDANPGIKVIGHPECPSDVLDACDFAGSTGGMIDYVKKNQPKKVMLVTECSMSDNVQADNPNVEFIKPCNLCPYMKKITLQKILDCLENETNEVLIEEKMAKAARQSVQRMAEIGR